MAGPRSGLPVRMACEGQPSLTFASSPDMNAQRKTRLILMPIQIYGLAALLAQTGYRGAYGHEASSAFMIFAMWSCVAAGFLEVFGAAVQEHLRFRGDAVLNLALGLFFILASANLAPFIAR